MREGQHVRIARPRERSQGCLVHQGPEREVREEKAPGLLPDELRGLAPEDPLPTPEMRLELVERRLHLPPLMIERREFRRRRAGRLQHGRHEPVRRVGRGQVGLGPRI